MIGGVFPEFLQSLGESSPGQNAAPEEEPEQLEVPPRCVAGLRSTLDAEDFGDLESQVRTIRDLAERAGAKTLADHAMRIQLAARAGHSRRALAAIDRFEQTLHHTNGAEELPKTPLQPCPSTEECQCSGSS